MSNQDGAECDNFVQKLCELSKGNIFVKKQVGSYRAVQTNREYMGPIRTGYPTSGNAKNLPVLVTLFSGKPIFRAQFSSSR